MNTKETAKNYMERTGCFQNAINAVEGLKDDYWYNKNKKSLAEELAKSEAEQNGSDIEYYRNEIAEAERKNGIYEEIEGLLLKLMMGGTIK